MSGKTPSSPLIILLFSFAAAFADPVLLSSWEWNDPEGILHEFQAFSFSRQSWGAANRQLTEGWHLATITSPEEQEALITGLEKRAGEFGLGGYQSGLQIDPENDWAWVTGESWNYKNWAPGEPNDAHGCASEQYIAVSSSWRKSKWLWNDEGYLPNINGYIAERTTSSVPEPGQLTLLAAGLAATVLMLRRKKHVRDTETPFI